MEALYHTIRGASGCTTADGQARSRLSRAVAGKAALENVGSEADRSATAPYIRLMFWLLVLAIVSAVAVYFAVRVERRRKGMVGEFDRQARSAAATERWLDESGLAPDPSRRTPPTIDLTRNRDGRDKG